MRKKRVAQICFFAVFLAPAMVVAQDITTGLEGYWSFDSFEGGVASDLSGKGRDATIFEGQPLPAAGKVGNALYFDGNTDLTVPWKGVLGNAPRTIAMWLKTSVIANVGMAGWGPNNTGEKWHFRINETDTNGVVGAIRTEYAGSQTVATTIVTDGAWHHVVSVFDGEFPDDVVHYVDGVLEAQSWVGATDLAINTTEGDDVSIGSRIQGTDHQQVNGSLDEVRIYSRALSAADVKALFDQGAAPQSNPARAFSASDVAVGGSVDVSLALVSGSAGTLTETLPNGWTASNISDGGTASGNTITWTVTSSISSVSYTAKPGTGTTENVFSGRLNNLITDGQLTIVLLQGSVGEFALHTDIGSVDAEGSASFDGNEYTLQGSGVDVWGSADGFHFAFNEIEGPFVMRGNALVFPLESSNAWVKGGVMIRNNLTAGSSYGFNLVRTDLQMASQARSSQGGAAFTVRDLFPDQAGDMEIERNGQLIKFYYIDLNGDRQEFGETILSDLEDPVYAGLAITSHENGSLSELAFSNLEIELLDLVGSRQISGGGRAFAGSAKRVELNVFTRGNAAAEVTEQPPAGWVVSNVQTSIGSATVNAEGKIVWPIGAEMGSFTLSYDVAIPDGGSGGVEVKQFSGTINNNEISGENVVEVVSLFPADVLAQQDITSGLIGHWTFDEGSGSAANDASGQNRTAEFVGQPEWVPGVSGSALSFTGDDGLFTPSWYGIDGSSPRTILCWIKTTATNTHGIISWGLSSENGAKQHFRVNNSAANGTVGAIRTEIQGTFNIGSTVVNDDEWHMVASVLPEGGLFVVDYQHYVDGILEEMSGTNANGEVIIIDTFAEEGLSDQEFRIGMSVQSGADRFFPGLIDEVRVYDRGLTVEEIQAVMVAVTGGPTAVQEYMLY